MRIAIITMHRGYNFGSALQVYALCETIKQFGYEPIVLDYWPKRIQHSGLIKSIVNIAFNQNGIYNKYISLRGLLKNLCEDYYYNRFFSRNISLTRKYLSLQDLQQDVPKADVYMTGSDQVWNSIHNQGIDDAFYLSFVSEDSKKVAYAASFGKENLDEWEKTPILERLQTYKYISVRENSAVDIVKDLGLNASLVLDPTFLLNYISWRNRVPKIKFKEKYLLIYSVEPNKVDIIKMAKRIADQMNLKVYMVEWGLKKYSGVDKMIFNISPLTLMSYFFNAQFIVASSFHGTALSINLNKQFISFAPEKFSTRVKSILNEFGIEDRFLKYNIKDEDLDNIVNRKIDYDKINEKLERLRSESIAHLKHLIED